MIRSDEPIERPEDDVLGRANLAAVIAGEIRRIDAKDGFVVGVLGPWGSGKTSPAGRGIALTCPAQGSVFQWSFFIMLRNWLT